MIGRDKYFNIEQELILYSADASLKVPSGHPRCGKVQQCMLCLDCSKSSTVQQPELGLYACSNGLAMRWTKSAGHTSHRTSLSRIG